MKDDSHIRPGGRSAMEDAEVAKLARRAIAVLASSGHGQEEALKTRLVLLCDAFLALEEERRHELLLRLRQDGVSTDDLIDHVIPATARLMGERWFADEISFAHVTIGAARLQEAVRAMAWHDRKGRRPVEAPSILLVIPRVEQHTLGAFVAADQFQRRGYEVDLAVDRHPRQIAEMLRRRPYRMVGITASGRRTLASARELVDIIRATVTRVTPIVIGGTVLETDINVLKVTGADFVARDAQAALRKCGLELVRSAASPMQGDVMPVVKDDRR